MTVQDAIDDVTATLRGMRGLRPAEENNFSILRSTQILEFASKEIELAKAMQDRESMIKHQIKMETLKTAREIFGRGYHIATGRKAWDEQDKR